MSYDDDQDLISDQAREVYDLERLLADVRLELSRIAIELSGWMEDGAIPRRATIEMAARWAAVDALLKRTAPEESSDG